MSTLRERVAAEIAKAVGNAPSGTGVEQLKNPLSYGLPSDDNVFDGLSPAVGSTGDQPTANTGLDLSPYLPDPDSAAPVQQAAALTSIHAALGEDTVAALQANYTAPQLHQLAGQVRPHVHPETHGAILAAAAMHETGGKGSRLESLNSDDVKRILRVKRDAHAER